MKMLCWFELGGRQLLIIISAGRFSYRPSLKMSQCRFGCSLYNVLWYYIVHCVFTWLLRWHSKILSMPTNINVTKITWRPIGSWTRCLESLNPSCSTTNAKTGYFCAVKLRVNLILFMDFTSLFMSSWTRSLIISWLMESAIWFRWVPSCSLRVIPFWVMIV